MIPTSSREEDWRSAISWQKPWLAELIEKPCCLAVPALGGSTQARPASTVSPITGEVVAFWTLSSSALFCGKSDGIANAGAEAARARKLTAELNVLRFI